MFDANLTLKQLGTSQNRLVTMIGAKHFSQDKESRYVQFDFMKGTNKSNMIQIRLNDADLYDMVFYKKGNRKDKDFGIRMPFCDEVHTIENVPCEKLTNIFEAETGLRLSL